jgi:hypothetical protein
VTHRPRSRASVAWVSAHGNEGQKRKKEKENPQLTNPTQHIRRVSANNIDLRECVDDGSSRPAGKSEPCEGVKVHLPQDPPPKLQGEPREESQVGSRRDGSSHAGRAGGILPAVGGSAKGSAAGRVEEEISVQRTVVGGGGRGRGAGEVMPGRWRSA